MQHVIETGTGITCGIVENQLIPTGFVNGVPMGFQRVIVIQVDDTLRTEYRGLTLASAKALCAALGSFVNFYPNGTIRQTQTASYNRSNEADGFTVTVVLVNTTYSMSNS